MPTHETLERFIARVEQNAHVEAVEEFYTDNASMRENQSEPRVGRGLHLANERKVMARARSVRSECVRPVFVSGNNVVIRWIFEFEWLDGTVTQMSRRVAIAQIAMHWTTSDALNRPEESVEGGGSVVASPEGEVLFRLPMQASGVGIFTLGERRFQWRPQ